jgi:hypothetical protein
MKVENSMKDEFSEMYDRSDELKSPTIYPINSSFARSFDSDSKSSYLECSHKRVSFGSDQWFDEQAKSSAPNKLKKKKKTTPKSSTYKNEEDAYSDEDDYNFDDFGCVDSQKNRNISAKNLYSKFKSQLKATLDIKSDMLLPKDVKQKKTTNSVFKKRERRIIDEEEELYSFDKLNIKDEASDYQENDDDYLESKSLALPKKRKRTKRIKIDEDDSFIIDELSEVRSLKQSSSLKSGKKKRKKGKKYVYMT